MPSTALPAENPLIPQQAPLFEPHELAPAATRPQPDRAQLLAEAMGRRPQAPAGQRRDRAASPLAAGDLPSQPSDGCGELREGDDAGVPGAVLRPPPPSAWLAEPRTAFIRWKQSQRVRGKEFAAHSIEQYASMFGRFLAWLAERQGRSFLQARAGDVDAFLDALNTQRAGKPRAQAASSSTRRRYLLLLHSIYEHVRLLELRSDNPCESMIQLTRNQAYERPAPTIMWPAAAQRFIYWCTERPRIGWADWRDRALRLVFLGSGIGVAEARALELGDIVMDEAGRLPEALRVRPHGFVRERLAPLCEFARQPLADWLQVRSQLGLRGPVVFISRTHNFAGEMPGEDAISQVEVYTTVQAAMLEAGHTQSRQGPQTLRNTFIARMIQDGHDPLVIARWTGLHTTESVSAIGRLVPRRQERGQASAAALTALAEPARGS